jgi:hypothetical protein
VDLGISYTAEFYAELFGVIHRVIHKRFYNSIIMQFDPTAFTSLLIGLASLITTAALGVRWLTRHYFDEIKKELKPNHGSSIKDQVNRLEKDMQEAQEQRKETNKKIDHIYEILIDYIASNRK